MQRTITMIALVLMSTIVWAAKLPSILPPTEVIIDGNSQEWSANLYELQGKDITVGVMNDSTWLYICLYPTSREVNQQFIGMGYTLWINQYGKKREGLGIRFPGVMETMRQQRGSGRMRPEQTDDSRQTPPSVSLPDYVTIIRGDSETRVTQDEALGFGWAAVNNEGVPVYECRIPLTHNDVYTISCDATGGKTIALGIKGTTPQRSEDEAQPEHSMSGKGGGRSGGGRSGGGRMGCGRSGGMGGGNRDNASRPSVTAVDVWVKVKLTK